MYAFHDNKSEMKLIKKKRLRFYIRIAFNIAESNSNYPAGRSVLSWRTGQDRTDTTRVRSSTGPTGVLYGAGQDDRAV